MPDCIATQGREKETGTGRRNIRIWMVSRDQSSPLEVQDEVGRGKVKGLTFWMKSQTPAA